MTSFFENLDYGTAAELEQLSQLIYELRQNHNAVLLSYGAADAAALLQQIQGGAVAEHPAYEHYLAARILDDTRDMARAMVGERLKEASRK
ncbi:hypothetical protein [Thiobacillus sp.]|uniref:hypothetical protein n=1 Tax=Thiobacillus sp. TaxID=924 RepID=UPI0025D67838|nr:hypothetical protein [Thiobacillus sp.]